MVAKLTSPISHGVDPYDQPQWALQFFVEGGFMLFLAVLGTARLSTWWRVIILGAWAWWSAHLSVEIRDRELFLFSKKDHPTSAVDAKLQADRSAQRM